MTELTWQEVNRIEAEREAERKDKIRELVGRLSKVLAKEFTFAELQLIKANALGMNAILIESFEIARQKARR
jgi:hypothetical protein